MTFKYLCAKIVRWCMTSWCLGERGGCRKVVFSLPVVHQSVIEAYITSWMCQRKPLPSNPPLSSHQWSLKCIRIIYKYLINLLRIFVHVWENNGWLQHQKHGIWAHTWTCQSSSSSIIIHRLVIVPVWCTNAVCGHTRTGSSRPNYNHDVCSPFMLVCSNLCLWTYFPAHWCLLKFYRKVDGKWEQR
jgi:hypothetical protein